MSEDKKKGKVEDAADKTGKAIGEVGKKGWGAIKGAAHGLKKGWEKKEENEEK